MVKRVVSTGLACEIDLPKHWKIHPVVSITKLEPAPQTDDLFNRPCRRPRRVRTEEDKEGRPQPELLLQERHRRVGGRAQKDITEFLVRWKGASQAEDTWVKEAELQPAMVRKYRRRRQ